MFCLRLDRHRNNRIREGRRLQQDWKILVAERVTRGDVLNADDRRDIARIAGIDVLAFVRLDLDQTTDPLALVGAGIIDVIALAQFTGVDAKENQFSNEWVAPEFESEGAELPFVVRRRFHLLMSVRLHSDCGRNIERSREIIDHGVDEILHAFVLEGRPSDDGDELVGDRLAADAGLQHLWRDWLLLEDGLGNLVVYIRNSLNQIGVCLFYLHLVLFRNVAHLVDRTHRVVI
jgi:hypothetical protein